VAGHNEGISISGGKVSITQTAVGRRARVDVAGAASPDVAELVEQLRAAIEESRELLPHPDRASRDAQALADELADEEPREEVVRGALERLRDAAASATAVAGAVAAVARAVGMF
jgi:hypothetical protein